MVMCFPGCLHRLAVEIRPRFVCLHATYQHWCHIHTFSDAWEETASFHPIFKVISFPLLQPFNGFLGSDSRVKHTFVLAVFIVLHLILYLRILNKVEEEKKVSHIMRFEQQNTIQSNAKQTSII